MIYEINQYIDLQDIRSMPLHANRYAYRARVARIFAIECFLGSFYQGKKKKFLRYLSKVKSIEMPT